MLMSGEDLLKDVYFDNGVSFLFHRNKTKVEKEHEKVTALLSK